MSLFGGIVGGIGAALGLDSASKDRKYQKQFAQNQIQWRVADAKAAGVHPLYALGASVTPYTSVGDGGAGASMSALGQDISRAKMATLDRREREAAANAAALDARMRMENERARTKSEIMESAARTDLIRSQIARLNSAQVGPPQPALESSMGGRVEPQPSRPTIGHPNNPARDPGSITEYRFSQLPNGDLVPVPSTDWQGMVDEMFSPQGMGWTWRNNIVPFFDHNYFPRPDPQQHPPRPGYEWRWTGRGFRQFRQFRRRPDRRENGQRRPMY